MVHKSELPDYDGTSAYGGALRFHDPADKSWVLRWGHSYCQLMPAIDVFASDAFGTVFGLTEEKEVAVFWPETGELERLGIGPDDFYEMIARDPEGTISLSTYLGAVGLHGKPSPVEHFALRIETAVGGKFSPDNMVIMDADSHLRALGKIALQVSGMPIGTRVTTVRVDEQ